MVMWMVLLGCAGTEPLDQWCKDEQMHGPYTDVVCDLPTADEVGLDYRCGRWDVATHSSGFSGHDMYFDADGWLVAVEFWDDVWINGEEIDSRYGRRILSCEPECFYREDGTCEPL